MITGETGNQILFIVYPTVSHYISILPIAKTQKARGHTIYVGGTDGYKDLIERNGFTFFRIAYYESFDLVTFRSFLTLFLASFRKQFTRSRYKSFLSIGARLVRQIEDAGISDVFLDAHLSFYYIFMPGKIRVTIVNTKLSTLKSDGVPPLSSSIIPKRSWPTRVHSNLIWYQLYLRNLMIILKRRLAFHGMDDSLFVRRVLRNKGFKYKEVFLPEYKTAFYHEVNLDLVRLPTYITGLQKIEYEWKKLHKEESYVTVQPLIHYSEKQDGSALQMFIGRYHALAAHDKVRLIYVAFGTITARHAERIRKFINKLIAAFARDPEYMVVISTGGIDCKDLSGSDNIFLRQRIPQANVLAHCTAMITHGGMNSIRECYHFRVPMLVYALRKFDQPGNAARIQYHGLGLKGKMTKDSIRTIRKKVAFIATIDRNRFIPL